MSSQELCDNKLKIDKIFEEVKRLNEMHNNFLFSKEESDSSYISNNEEVKKFIPKFTKIGIIRVLLFLVATILNMFGFIGEGLYIVAILVALGSIGRNNKKFNDLKKKVINNRSMQELEDNQVYEELCEKRSSYNQMKLNHEERVRQLSSSEYQEYLEFVNEYLQVVDSVQEKCSEIDQEQAPFIRETPKKRRILGNFFVNKSTMQ